MTAVTDLEFRCPRDLAISDIKLNRIMVIGSCLAAGLPEIIKRSVESVEVDYTVLNNVGELPNSLPYPATDYDFQVVQVPLRFVLPDLALARLGYDDHAAYERLFLEVVERARVFLWNAMKWNIEHSLPTFVFNFLTPMQSPIGRLLPRYDLRNPVYFIERLNQAIADELQNYNNSYLFDFDSLVATYGRRFFSDDMVAILNHAAIMNDGGYELDAGRLEPLAPGTTYYPGNGNISLAAGVEVIAMYRTLRRADEIKLVVVDVDDTLWRGVAAEEQNLDPAAAYEGWPLGMHEALSFLQQRGILLAMLSKNDDDKLTRIWGEITSGRFSLSAFAVRKVNWRPKVENFAEILEETNLLSRNVLYIDDNPVERAAIKAAYPDVRVLGPNPYLWRRILLWSPETQVAQITAESAKRTEMVQAQVRRETERKVMSRDDFLMTLELQVALWEIDRTDHPRFVRSLELINKTNQFNTTGRRWTAAEANEFLIAGGRFYAFDARDKYTAYGVIGVAAFKNDGFEQFVMSCRVIGMDVELAAIAAIVGAERSKRAMPISAKFAATEANSLCRDLYAGAGFESSDEGWQLSSEKNVAIPAHISVHYETADLVAV